MLSVVRVGITKWRTIIPFCIIPFLAVSIKSLLCNASKEYFYNIHVLTDGLSDECVEELKKNMTSNSKLIIDNVSEHVAKIKKKAWCNS